MYNKVGFVSWLDERAKSSCKIWDYKGNVRLWVIVGEYVCVTESDLALDSKLCAHIMLFGAKSRSSSLMA